METLMMTKKLIATFLLYALCQTSISDDCIPLDEGEYFSQLGWGLKMPVTDLEVQQACFWFADVYNEAVKSGSYEGQVKEYTHFWCMDDKLGQEFEVVIDFFGQESKSGRIGGIYNTDIESLMLSLMDGLVLPVFDDALKQQMNKGDPMCDPDCLIEGQVNPYAGNLFQELSLYSDTRANFSLYYNSVDGSWSHELEAGLEALDDPDYADEVEKLKLPDGRVVTMLKSQGVYPCAPYGAMGYGDRELSEEFTVELLNRIYTILPDGTIKDIFHRDINDSLNITWNQNEDGSVVLVRASNVDVGYDAIIDDLGNLVLVREPGSDNSNPDLIVPKDSDAQLNWSTEGNLESVTYNGMSKSFLYEDPNNPKLLTAIVGSEGVLEKGFSYDNEGRIIKTYKLDGSDNQVDVVQLDYSDIESSEPNVKVTHSSGLVERRYFGEYFGVYKTTKITQGGPNGDEFVRTEKSYNRLGHLLQSIDSDGVLTDYQRDGRGRVLQKDTVVSGEVVKTEEVTWDSDCELPATSSDGRVLMEYQYDDNCRKTSQSRTSLN
ncbi:RHS repeat domain-containing protein [Gilvimarinus sp. SDUM040013]|uniref:RHS repeat domain-containing protein n=1 Tax=Gilvimarinus gilvus TaxID=3058038 RepID=A0ABU4RZH0_9GAMM|nr:RHS repeat domain-containing protein [Gilvimarinus sp. SDUM040013]MDO3388121.1 RHS repeat domain-containing protein [Gilvimarinus sp. SDUM040013]MDX6850304.1 RHS repeat domain-containing protein [Gilvimarinus sp. SDUM040013]